jgi:hypothetical protein
MVQVSDDASFGQIDFGVFGPVNQLAVWYLDSDTAL